MILTGLSMGGHGSWDLATAHPGTVRRRGPHLRPGGDPENADRIKGLPVWTFCGDADRDETVLNIRAMVETLRRTAAPRGSPSIAASATTVGTAPTTIPS